MLHQVTITLTPELMTFVRKAAERDSRPISLQVRHYVAEAARRAGSATAGLEEWPPPLPGADTLPALEAERDALEAKQRKLGVRFMPGDEDRLRYLRETCRTVRQAVETLQRAQV